MSMQRRDIATSMDEQTIERLGALARDLGLSRADVMRRIVAAALRDAEAIERWKDAVLGPRFDFAPPPRRADA